MAMIQDPGAAWAEVDKRDEAVQSALDTPQNADPATAGHYIMADTSNRFSRIPRRAKQAAAYLGAQYNIGKTPVYRAAIGREAFAGLESPDKALGLVSKRRIADLETQRKIDGLALVTPKPVQFLSAAANTLPVMVDTVKKGGAAAGLGAIIGGGITRTPQGALLGAKVMGGVGVFANIAVIEGTNMFLDLVEDGVEEGLARKASLVHGAVAAAVETFEWAILTDPIRKSLVSNLAKGTGKEILTKYLESYVMSVGTGVLEENIQSLSGAATKDLAKKTEELSEVKIATKATSGLTMFPFAGGFLAVLDEDIQSLSGAVIKVLTKKSEGLIEDSEKTTAQLILEEANLGATTAEALKAMSVLGLIPIVGGAGVTKVRQNMQRVQGQDMIVAPEGQVPDTPTVGGDDVQARAETTPEQKRPGIDEDPQVVGDRTVEAQEAVGAPDTSETSPRDTVKLTQAEIDKVAGIEDLTIEKAPGTTLKESYAAAKAKGLDLIAEDLANQVLSEGKILSDQEHQGLVLRYAQIETEMSRLQDSVTALQEHGNIEATTQLNNRMDRLIATRDKILDAGRFAGTRLGQAMNARKTAIVKATFDLANLLSEAQKFKGDKLTVQEKATIAELAKQIKAQQKTIDALEAKIKKQEDSSGELATDLRKELRDNQVELFQTKRSATQSVRKFRKSTKQEIIKELATAPRTLLTIGEMSGAFRQALWLGVRRPGQFAKAFATSFDAFFRQNTADRVAVMIRQSDKQYLRDRSHLFLSDIDSHVISQREANVASNLLEKVPLLGSVVRASQRHMVTMLNLMRLAAFDSYVDAHPDASIAELRAWADYVNKASGRGDLRAFEKVAEEMSILMFAPRYTVSKFQTPLALVKHFEHKGVRMEIAKDMAAFVGTGMLALALASLAGAEVGTDPESSDWGKIIVGDTRIDIWGGFQQPARLIVNLMLQGADRAGFAELKKEADPLDTIMQFAKYKLSPTVTIPAELIRGKNVIGQDNTVPETLAKAVIPLYLQDVYDLVQHEDNWVKIGGLSLALFFGASAQVHTPKERKRRRRSR